MTAQVMIENLSNMIKEEIVKLNFHEPYGEGVRPIEPIIFRAYKVDDKKIIITIKESENGEESIFCNYLEDESEMNTFFEGISVDTVIMDNSTFGTHYGYCENPKCEHVRTSFSIYDDTIENDIYFFEGLWSPPEEYVENGILEDCSYKDRDDIIGSYISFYLNDFFSCQETEEDNTEIGTFEPSMDQELENKQIMESRDIICDCGSKWKNREAAKNDIISMIKKNGYCPYVVENKNASIRILAICEHKKIPSIGIYNIIDVQHKGKKKWEWDQSQEYNSSISGRFIDDLCDDCSGRKESVVCDVRIIPEIYKNETLDTQIKKADIFYDIEKGIQRTMDNAWAEIQYKESTVSQPVIDESMIDCSLDPNFLDKISSIHIFGSGKTIAKYPLDRKENISFVATPDIIQKIEESGKWRIVKVNNVFHAVKNPDDNIIFDIPEELDFSGKLVVFGKTGSGKSTLLSYLGRLATSENRNVFTIESPKSLSIKDATCLDNNESVVNTVLLCRPDLVLFDEIRDKKHFAQLKQLSLACPDIIGSFHATEIFEALARFSSLNGDRSYGELSTVANKFVHIQNGKIVNWYTLETTLSSKLRSEFYCDGERPVTEIRDRNNNVVGWLFYFANDINIVKNDKYRGNKKNSGWYESTRIRHGKPKKILVKS